MPRGERVARKTCLRRHPFSPDPGRSQIDAAEPHRQLDSVDRDVGLITACLRQLDGSLLQTAIPERQSSGLPPQGFDAIASSIYCERCQPRYRLLFLCFGRKDHQAEPRSGEIQKPRVSTRGSGAPDLQAGRGAAAVGSRNHQLASSRDFGPPQSKRDGTIECHP